MRPNLLAILGGIVIASGCALGLRGVESPGVEAGDDYRRDLVAAVRTCQAAGMPVRFVVRRDVTDIRCGSLAATIPARRSP